MSAFFVEQAVRDRRRSGTRLGWAPSCPKYFADVHPQASVATTMLDPPSSIRDASTTTEALQTVVKITEIPAGGRNRTPQTCPNHIQKRYEMVERAFLRAGTIDALEH